MILVDANVLMYAAGSEHPNKLPSLQFLKRVALGDVLATIDAEVLQEILHRYRSLNRWPDGQRVYDMARRIFPNVLPVGVDVMDRARQLLDSCPGVMTRDGVHAAVVFVEQLESLCTYDQDFKQIPHLATHPPDFWLSSPAE